MLWSSESATAAVSQAVCYWTSLSSNSPCGWSRLGTNSPWSSSALSKHQAVAASQQLTAQIAAGCACSVQWGRCWERAARAWVCCVCSATSQERRGA